MMRSQLGERGLGHGGIDVLVGRIMVLDRVGELDLAVLTGEASPMVGELVAGDADQPGDRYVGHCLRTEGVNGTEKRVEVRSSAVAASAVRRRRYPYTSSTAESYNASRAAP